MGAREELLTFIFDGQRPALYREFERWLSSSRRFQAFATEHRGKIRAKLRNAREGSVLQDLRAELAAASILLHEDRFTLEYEKYAAAKARGPDYTVTFRTHLPFNVEVRRLRPLELAETSPEAIVGKLVGVLCDKVGQMPPSIANLLWLTVESELPPVALEAATLALRQLAEGKAEDFFKQRGFASAAAFLKQYRRLSGAVWQQSGETTLWLNPLAQHKLLPDIATAIRRLSSR